jgi:hypothetical protein
MASIERQIMAMKELWPNLRLVVQDGPSAVWQGPLRPLLQSYDIEIRYSAPSLIELPNARRHQPEVSILSPPLRPRRGDREGSLPHVWYRPDGSVFLCMLDPDSQEWSYADLIAETTVPWAIEWLAAYEGWRATGQWTASGRHAETAAHG